MNRSESDRDALLKGFDLSLEQIRRKYAERRREAAPAPAPKPRLTAASEPPVLPPPSAPGPFILRALAALAAAALAAAGLWFLVSRL